MLNMMTANYMRTPRLTAVEWKMSMKESDGDGRTAAFAAMLPELEHFEESAIASALQRVGPVLPPERL